MLYLPLSANLSYRTRDGYGLLDWESLVGAGKQSCHNWPESPTDTKQNKQDICFVEKNFNCATSQVIFIAHLSLDVSQYLCRNVCVE
jgi:hypothetical protein